MRISLLFALTLSFLAINAQETHHISNAHEEGKIINGYKAGIWEYFDQDGELVLKVDYDKADLLYIRRDTQDYYIQKDGSWTLSKLNRPPMYLGSPVEFDNYVYNTIRYPSAAGMDKSVGSLIVSFEVTKEGFAHNFKVVQDFGLGAAEDLLKTLQMIPNTWMPASDNDLLYDSRFYLAVHFVPEGIEIKRPESPSKNSGINRRPALNLYKEYFIKGKQIRKRV